MVHTYPKPTAKKTPTVEYPEGVGGREVCSKTPAGRREYKKRLELMWERQEGLCALCGHPMRLSDATFDHELGRGMGGSRRDDRIEIDGQPHNAAVSWICNAVKASRRVQYLITPRVSTDKPIEELLIEESL